MFKLICLLSFLVTVNGTCAGSIFGNICYVFHAGVKKYSDAEAACIADAGHLVSVHSSGENEFVKALGSSVDIFLGFSDQNVEGTFVWSDGSSASYTNWTSGAPNADGGAIDCTEQQGSNGKWKDIACSEERAFVCRITTVFADVGGGDCRKEHAQGLAWGSETTTNATANGKCGAQSSCMYYMNTYPSAGLASYTEYYCSSVEGVCSNAATVANAACSERFLILLSACGTSVMASSSVTSSGSTKIAGDLALHPGLSITGSPSVFGVSNVANGLALQEKLDMGTAYTYAQGLLVNRTLVTNQDLGGQTLYTGVHYSATSMAITGTLYLDAQNDPDAYWVFQMGTTLTVAVDASVVILNPAEGNVAATARNLFWACGSSATINARANFAGTVMAYASITAGTGAVTGPLLASNGVVSLLSNTITSYECCNGAKPDFKGRRCFKGQAAEASSAREMTNATPLKTSGGTGGNCIWIWIGLLTTCLWLKH